MTLSSRPLTDLLRIIFRRGSPERILYSRQRFRAALAAAVILSVLVQHFFFTDHLVFVILRLFAELTMFMVWMALLTAKVGRLRLGSAMLSLLLMSVLMDAVLLLLSPLMTLGALVDFRWLVVGVVGVSIAYGAGSCVAWALRKPLQTGLLHVALYLVAVTCLDLAFRELYQIMAAG